MAKLKVFRTAIGFHDAYVAAPSRKAALKAWGSDADLFARGVAEVVTDEALMAEPLARPGEVVKRSRGTAAEQFAALPPDRVKAKPVEARSVKAKAARAIPAAPRPDRAPMEDAEQALAEAEKRHRDEAAALAAEEVALAKRRRDMRAAHAAESEKLEGFRDAAEESYAMALKRWRESD